MKTLEAQRIERITRVMDARDALEQPTPIDPEYVGRILFAIDEAQRAHQYKEALQRIKRALLNSSNPLFDILGIVKEVDKIE